MLSSKKGDKIEVVLVLEMQESRYNDADIATGLGCKAVMMPKDDDIRKLVEMLEVKGWSMVSWRMEEGEEGRGRENL